MSFIHPHTFHMSQQRHKNELLETNWGRLQELSATRSLN